MLFWLLLPSGVLRRHQLLGLTRLLNLNANANAEAAIECAYNKSLHKDVPQPATAEVLFGLLSNFSLCLPYCLSASLSPSLSLSRFLYHTFFFSFCQLRNAIRRPMPALYRYSVTNSPWLRNNCKFNFAISRLPSLSVCLSLNRTPRILPTFFPGAHKNLLPNLSLRLGPGLGLGLSVRGINFQINWQNALRP